MLKKTITYTDYNGVERTEDFYFNLNKAELIELELRHADGFEGYLNQLIKADNRDELVDLFKKIILMSYGEKDPSGKRFIKSDELTQAFVQSEAYSELFMELATDDKAAAAFINGIVPAMASPAQLEAVTKEA